MKLLSVPALIALAACSQAPDRDTQKTERPQGSAAAHAAVIPPLDSGAAGSAMPDARFKQRDGTDAQLRPDSEGRRTLVNLWATWCAPCKAEMPALDALARSEAARIRVVTISQDLAGWAPVDAFYKKAGLTTLQPLLDDDGDLALAYKANGLPLSILYDARGRELWRVAGPVDWTSPQVIALLNAQ